MRRRCRMRVVPASAWIMDLFIDLRRCQGKQFGDLGPPPTPEQRSVSERNHAPEDVAMDDQLCLQPLAARVPMD
eukprot:5793233-Lingulodinium_polyedra.AAC.1